MKEVARCLGELIELNSWNGLLNPFIMGEDVEIIEMPLKNQKLELGGSKQFDGIKATTRNLGF